MTCSECGGQPFTLVLRAGQIRAIPRCPQGHPQGTTWLKKAA